MKILYGFGSTDGFFQLERFEAHEYMEFEHYQFRIFENEGKQYNVIGFTRKMLEQLRDAIDIEIGPKE